MPSCPLAVDALVALGGLAVSGGFCHRADAPGLVQPDGEPIRRDPYFLYAASNLGSLLALLGYPLVIESQRTLREQAWGWTAGYGLLMILVAGCAVLLWRSAGGGDALGGAGRIPQRASHLAPPLRWLVLSLVPSSLLLGVTTYISTDVAAIPLLWVLPLALYL